MYNKTKHSRLTILGLYLFLFIFKLQLQAQVLESPIEICGMSAFRFNLEPLNEANSSVFNQTSSTSSPIVAKNYAIHFTIVREENCTNSKYQVTVKDLKDVINDINNKQYFYATDPTDGLNKPFINFYFGGAKFVIDQQLATIENVADDANNTLSNAFTEDNDLSQLSPNINAIKVYIVQTKFSNGRFPFLAVANTKNSTTKAASTVLNANMIVLSDYKIGSTVNTFEKELAHELGHYFGLVHTHEQTTKGPNHSPPSNPEFVDGTNSTTAGDKLTDTPADPNAKYCMPNSCNPQFCDNNLIDLNPNNPLPYQPDRFNPMGYYYPAYRCANNGAFQFSNSQKEIMLGLKNDFFNNTATGILHTNRTIFANQNITPIITDFHAGEFRISKCDNTTPFDALSPLKAVNIDFDNNNTSWKTLADCNRYIGTNNVPSTGIHKVLPKKENDPLWQVSALDLVLISKHILGTQPFTNAYKMIAADLNNDGQISTSDVVDLRKTILGLQNNFSGVPSWRFLSKWHEDNIPNFVNSNPFTQSFNGKNYLAGTTTPSYLDHVEIDYGNANMAYEPKNWSFIGIKMGDVSCGSGGAALTENIIEAYVEVDTNTNNRLIKPVNTLYEVDVLLKNQTAIEAYQLGFDYPKDKFELVGVRRGDDPNLDLERNFNIGEPGKVKMLWYQEGEQGLNQQQEKTNLFRLLLAPKGNVGNLKEILSLDKESFYSAFYSRELAETKTFLTLKVSRVSQGGSTPTIKTIKSDKVNIYPNPTDGSIYCTIPLSTNSPIVITLSDMYGKVVYEQKMFGTVGTNEIEIENLAQYHSNMLYYSIKTDEGVMTGKVMVK